MAIVNRFPDLKQSFVETSESKVCCYTSDLGSGPILTLIHGYPQSAFIWRHVVPSLRKKVSLFIPEIPGYGISTPCKSHTKKVVGSALLEALTKTFNLKDRKVILGGHDRGARICHRLAVDKDEFDVNIVGAVLLDIVPTKAQWDAFSNPAICAGYFHWPLLANVQTAVNMLEAYGGGRWCREAHSRIAGSNEAGVQRLKSENAIEVHAELFEDRETLVATCEDYAAGSTPEYEAQAEDQKNGRKIQIPTLVMFSTAKLGARIDVARIWESWVERGKLKAVGVGDGYGHYLPEEAADWVETAVADFVNQFR